ncbi:hypothetical protein CK627_20805 [Aeromonas dhakensis]|uniref:H-NS family histone-like protein n=1 Tax=Aeromonas dhakensis TaxID=196024 RepID=UPI000BAA96E2|nr:hypothetical protein [Aeromonas dhakensis]ASX13049.1 hypothetical protein CK627_20805 [Aeromonas dhakensis]
MSEVIKTVTNIRSVRVLARELGFDTFADVVDKFNSVFAEMQAEHEKEAKRQAELDEKVEELLANIPEDLREDVLARIAGTVQPKAPAEAKEKGTRTVQPPVEVVVDGKEYTVKMAGKIPTELAAVMKAKGFETKDRIKFAEQFKK